MKNYLVVTLGAPASGKSTFLKEKGLDKYTVSSDQIRLLFSAPVQTEEGQMEISQGKDKKVWETLKNVVEDRVEKGEFTIIDATHTRAKYWKDYSDLCQKHGAELVCLDFRGVDKETLIKRDQEREMHKQVGEGVIERFYEQSEKLVIPKNVKVVKPENWDEYFQLEYKDLSAYDKIHHIGDIHACYEVLNRYFVDGLKENEFYIFLGDYVDRGLQNKEVLDFLMTIKGRPNVVLLQGNHEKPLQKWAKDLPFRSNEFKRYTQPELEEKGVSKKKIYSLVYRMRDYFTYEYAGKKVMVNHGGIVKVPTTKYEIPSEQMIRGVSNYEFDVDAAFTEKNGEEHYQLHGHRNIYGMPTFASERSFNLEGQVERGGHLRIVTLDKNGFEAIELENKSFSTRFIKGEKKDFKNQALLNELRNDKGIRESKLKGDWSSFNFKESVFYDNNWTSRRIKTRGLFLNTETTEIVVRGYDKFFNVGELRHTEMDSLKNTLVFPLDIYVKENGFLGLIGYDSAYNKMMLTTKMTISGQYADLFRAVWDAVVPTSQEEDLRLYLRDHNVSLTFEVIDPLNDPHMVMYDKPKLVLLDVIYREEAFRKYTYEQMVEVAKQFGFPYKEREAVIETFEQFETFIDEKSTMDNVIEGYVVEDQKGFQTKIKLPHYRYWKWTRSQLKRMLKGKELEAEYLAHPVSIELNIVKELARIIEQHPDWVRKEDMANISHNILLNKK